LVICREVCT